MAGRNWGWRRAGSPPVANEVLPGEEQVAGSDAVVNNILQELVAAQSGVAKSMAKLSTEVAGLRKSLDAIRLQVMSEKLDDVFSNIYPRLLSMPQTLKQLSETERSLSRFGDGEFRMLLRPDVDLQFQKNSPELHEELRQIIGRASDDRLLVGFPPPYRGPHWSGVWADNWEGLKQLLPREGTFGNAHISRPIFFEHFGSSGVDMWRDVWSGKVVTVISGKGSRFELHPELFDNLKSVNRIDAPPKNAYAKLKAIQELVSRDSKTDLFLVALGPAGSVLASRLAASGRRALDVGHVASSFSNVFKGDGRPEQQPFVKTDHSATVKS